MLKKRQALENDESGRTSSSITSVSHHVNNNAEQGAADGDHELEEKTTAT